MATRRTMEAGVFDETIQRLNISERATQMGRLVLVDQKTQSEVAKEYGVTIGAVSHQVTRIWRTYVDSLELPAGHERITAVLPAEKAEIVRTWERDSRRTR